MSRRTLGWPNEALLKALIAYLDAREDQRQVWRGLHFMEANGLDLSLRYSELHGYLASETDSPIEDAHELSHDDERKIVLALRDIIRRDLGLAALTEEERAAWKYERLEPFRWPPEKLVSRVYGETYQPTSAEIAQIKEKIATEQSDIMRALKLFAEHNASMVGQPEKTHSTLWIRPQLTRIIAKMRPDLEATGVNNCVNALIDEIRTAERNRYELVRRGDR